MWSAFFVHSILPEILRISFRFNLLNKTKIVQIWRKFNLSPEILKAQKRQTTIWKCQDKGYFVIISSRIFLLKKSLRKNAANNFKVIRRPSKTSSYCHVSWDTLYAIILFLSWFKTSKLSGLTFIGKTPGNGRFPI